MNPAEHAPTYAMRDPGKIARFRPVRFQSPNPRDLAVKDRDRQRLLTVSETGYLQGFLGSELSFSRGAVTDPVMHHEAGEQPHRHRPEGVGPCCKKTKGEGHDRTGHKCPNSE